MAVDREQLIRGLLQLAESLSSSLPLEVRLTDLCRTTVQLVGCDRSSIFLREGRHYRAKYNHGNPPDIAMRFPQFKVSLRDPLISQAMQTRSFVVLNDAQHSPLMNAQTARRARIQSIVVAPLFDDRREPLGFITAEYNENFGAFTEAMTTLVLGLAKLAELACLAHQHAAERQQAEEALRRLNRTLHIISECNQALVHAASEPELLQVICRILVERGGYRMAWAGFAQADEANTVRPIAHAGVEEGYLDLHITYSDTELGRGPTGTAIRKGQVCTCRDIFSDPCFGPWRDEALRRGYGSSIALPLLIDGKAFGALNIYSARPDAFDAEEESLLTELAKDLAYGIAALRARAERKRAEAEQEEETAIAGAFGRVGQELISSLSSPALLDRLCQVTTEVLGCDRSSTSLWDAREEAFVPVASYGDSPEQWETIRLLRFRRSALATQIEAMERDGIFKMKIADLPDSGPKAAARACGVTASMMVPLRRGSELVGFHTADYCGREEVLSERHERIARGIAQLASLALESVQLIEELERANRLKSDFVATMSQELRTPLSNILGYSDLLLDGGFGPMTKDQVDTLQRIGKSAEGLLKLITATLDLSSLDTGQVQLDVQAIDLLDLVRELDTEISGLRENPNVNFAWDVAPELPELRSDPAKLKLVLKNLISNAIKFTHAGSVVVRLRARDGGVEITVADTGIGIAREMLPVIFEPFRQGEPAMTRQHRGVGLGLYIVRRAIDVLGGTIEAESTVGQGSAFCVWVPSQVAA